ncbi:hypothetical protein [Clostridium sp. C8-1-8]|uniref:hypothetical protein n=1 Tax=Clostridium sp. C8-1-8 TaxID=2698831 RepID=UPI00136F9700|nr:hypothetical protein [Clostridium sp. C8-1-8]
MKKVFYSLLFAGVVVITTGFAAKADTSPNNSSVHYWASLNIQGSYAVAATSADHAVDSLYTTVENNAYFDSKTSPNDVSATVRIDRASSKTAWSGHRINDSSFGNWSRGLKLDNGVLSVRW